VAIYAILEESIMYEIFYMFDRIAHRIKTWISGQTVSSNSGFYGIVPPRMNCDDPGPRR
jgi:hypothetical protein